METTFDGAKILVVDDEVKACSLLKTFLQRKKFSVEAAHCGEEALNKIRDFNPAVVLLDILMPGPGGDVLIKWIKGWKPEIEIIVTTAVVSKKPHDYYLQQGAFACIQKPILFDALYSEIKVALQYRNQILADDAIPVPQFTWQEILDEVESWKGVHPV